MSVISLDMFTLLGIMLHSNVDNVISASGWTLENALNARATHNQIVGVINNIWVWPYYKYSQLSIKICRNGSNKI